ncbi:MAG: Holliday junction branch migration protein RuvA [Rickettsiales bacterium]|nr:Holliday junction branch migration protein RuvA [Rickettsiales bacterium]
MIGSLRGKIINIFDNSILLEVNNTGYQVNIGSRNLANIQKNDELFVYIHTAVREDDISLFGFFDIADKEIFLKLNKVSGIGAKTALNIIGVLDARAIIDAILFENKAAFTQVSGIGAKAAARIINDLKDKVENNISNIISISQDNSQKDNNNLLRDSLSALENLGYQRSQILNIVKDIVADENDLSQIITKSLQKLAK